MKIRLTPLAGRDLEDIAEYLEKRSPIGARNVLRAIENAIQFIGEYPRGSDRTDDPTIRVKLVLRYRYKIFYRIRDDAAEIVHVRHTSRRAWRTDQ